MTKAPWKEKAPVLVTGASGFLGGWIAEAFQAAGIPVIGGIRSPNRAVRLARFRIPSVVCDILKPEEVREAMEGCSAVVHCAVGDRAATVDGTRNVMEAAADLGLSRAVHISSIAVYGKWPGEFDEDSPTDPGGNPYGEAKLQAESVCQDLVARGVPIVTLRPTIVYGPFSKTWTLDLANRLHSGQWGTMGSAGEGVCGLVYVTDVVQAVRNALILDGVEGRTFVINGSDDLTWNEYFTLFNQALGLPPLRTLSPGRMRLKTLAMQPVRRLGKILMSGYRDRLLGLYKQSDAAAVLMKGTERGLKLTPTGEQLKLYALKARYSIERARSELSFQPRVDAARGTALSAAWLLEHGLIY